MVFRIDNYLEMYSVRDEDDLASFQTEQAREGAKLFARRLLAAMEAENQLRGLLDGEGKLTGFPAKRKKKMYALLYLAEKLEPGRDYSERESGEALASGTPSMIPQHCAGSCMMPSSWIGILRAGFTAWRNPSRIRRSWGSEWQKTSRDPCRLSDIIASWEG